MTAALPAFVALLSGSIVAHVITKATLASAVALLAARLCRRQPASVRHLLMSGTFAVLLVLPVAPFLIPEGFHVDIPVEYSKVAVPDGSAPADAVLTRVDPTGSPVPPGERSQFSTVEAVRAAWLLGVVLFLVPMSIGAWQLRQISTRAQPWPEGQRLVDSLTRERGLSRRIHVVRDARIAGPLTYGVLRPVIALPMTVTQWPAATVHSALVHEIEHVRRCDWFIHCLSRGLCAVYWCHPLVWMLWRQLRLEAEQACDDAVVVRGEAAKYAELLVTVAQQELRRSSPPLLAMATRGDLSMRVSAVLDRSRRRAGVRRSWIAVTGVAATACALLIAPLILKAQSSRFDVASVRQDISPLASFGSGVNTQPGGIFTTDNYTLLRLVQYAYGVLESQVIGGPAWARTDRFDITAKAATDVPADQIRLMVRTLLEERFRLRLRPERREMPVFELVLARDDGRVGPNLHDCSRTDDKGGLSTPEKPFVAPRGGAVAAHDCSGIAAVVNLVSARLQGVVVDKTGLTGEWRYDIYYGPDLASGANPDLPSFATALREQLGLKVERTRAAVDVLVIESVEPPTAD